MSSEQQPNQGGGSGEQVRMQHVTVRVPEAVSRGAFSTGVIVMTGPTEFILDFVQNIGGPPQVVARIVMPHGTLPQFAEALRKNLQIYTQRFGPPPLLPKVPPPPRPQTVQEIYDELKLPDNLLSGAYANGVMIGHTASEFKLDFLTNPSRTRPFHRVYIPRRPASTPSGIARSYLSTVPTTDCPATTATAVAAPRPGLGRLESCRTPRPESRRREPDRGPRADNTPSASQSEL